MAEQQAAQPLGSSASAGEPIILINSQPGE
jgi:hypothetical protein